MAVRQPLYWDAGSGSIKTMTTDEVNSIVSQVIYQYSLNPSVTLSVVSSGGNLGTISDTRKTAGAYLTRAGDGTSGDDGAAEYPPESLTQEPQTVTVNYAKISQTVASVSAPTSGAEGSYPGYYYNGGIRPMSNTDVYDTFIEPAINSLTLGSLTSSGQGGTYRIHTSSGGLGGHTLVSATAVFTDTRADTSLYTAAAIPEALDQPITITNFYLYRIDGTASSYIQPLRVTASNSNLQVFSTSLFNTLLQNHVRYAAAAASGLNIRYSYSTGNNRGSGMTNTILNGSGNYQTRFVNSNDYRAQEFPNGTAVTANTYYLKINKS